MVDVMLLLLLLLKSDIPCEEDEEGEEGVVSLWGLTGLSIEGFFFDVYNQKDCREVR